LLREDRILPFADSQPGGRREVIATCTECRRCYWKYRRDWSTPGFCSVFCRAIWRAERSACREDDPGIPVAILEVIKSHNRIVHHAEESLAWVNCSECERLESVLAAAIAYHLPVQTAEGASANA
jgi:hypothetical protein